MLCPGVTLVFDSFFFSTDLFFFSFPGKMRKIVKVVTGL